MDIRNIRQLKKATASTLSSAVYPPKQLALLHTGLALGVSVLLTVLQFILSQQIDGTGGLSGLGARSVLSTVQTVLNLANTLLLPFWELGFVYAALQMARGQEAGPASLLQGFRRFFPALRLLLLQFILYIGIGILSAQISLMIFIVSPFSQSLFALLQDFNQMTLDGDALAAVLPALLPLYGIMLALFCAIAIPLSYRFRMAQFVLLDQPNTGALKALGASHRMMRYNRFALFRLDLSFWWFYGLQILSAVLCYGDVLLTALGISLPISEDISFFLFFGLHLALQLLLLWQAGSYVQTTYATAYDVLRPEQEDKTTKNLPWDLLP